MTQDVLRPRLAAVPPRAPFPAVPPPHPTAVHPPIHPPPTDPDATVVIGRHRQDGTRSPRTHRRTRFVGRVAAGLVARLRGRGAAS